MTQSALSHRAAVDDIPYLSDQTLDIVGLLASSHHPACGAIVLFSGEVRNHSNGQDVDYLEYEVHESMANKMICEIIAEAKKQWPLNIAIAQHRSGRVAIGESAVVVITATAHRKEAYQANQYIINRIRHEVPIWKCEYFTDGTKEWGGNCNCQKITGDANKHIYD